MSTFAFDEEKFKELLLYIASKCDDHPRFGATKLRKVLFFADFLHYKRFGVPITGADYVALEFGPVPLPMGEIEQAMLAAGDTAIKSDGWQKRTIALREPDLARFSASEIAIVDYVCEALEKYTARDVSDLSHVSLGWQAAWAEAEATGRQVTIPYGTIFVESPTLDPFELAHAIELSRKHEWAI